MTKQARYRTRLRLAAMARLGGVCIRCGFSDERALEIDHIKPLLRDKRQRLQSDSTAFACREILNGKVCEYQLLCANCHAIKTKIDDRLFALSVNVRLRGELDLDAIEHTVVHQLSLFD